MAKSRVEYDQYAQLAHAHAATLKGRVSEMSEEMKGIKEEHEESTDELGLVEALSIS